MAEPSTDVLRARVTEMRATLSAIQQLCVPSARVLGH